MSSKADFYQPAACLSSNTLLAIWFTKKHQLWVWSCWILRRLLRCDYLHAEISGWLKNNLNEVKNEVTWRFSHLCQNNHIFSFLFFLSLSLWWHLLILEVETFFIANCNPWLILNLMGLGLKDSSKFDPNSASEYDG